MNDGDIVNGWQYDQATNSWITPTPRPAKPWYKTWWAIGGTTLVFLFVIVPLFASAVGTTSPSNPPPAAVQPADPEPAAPAPEPEPDPEPAVDAAAAAQYSAYAGEFGDLLGTISDAANNYDIDALTTGCQAMITKAIGGLAIPDVGIPTADTEWDAAMNDFQQAGQECAIAAPAYDSDGLERSVGYLESASGHLNAATAALDAAP